MRWTWNPGREWLERRYIIEKKTLAEIGKEADVSGLTVMRALDAVGISRRGPKERNNKRGPANGNWKEGGASYSALHKRIYKILGKAGHCEECGRSDHETVYNWANLTGKLDDPKDYASLCRACHNHLDDPNKNRRKDPCKKPASNILRIRGIQSPCDVPLSVRGVNPAGT
jgi:hypothetical protein